MANTLTVRVGRKREEAIDITSFRLVDPSGAPLPPFTPGAHIDIHVAPGLVRQYSLHNVPGPEGIYEIAVKREPASKGGSAAMHALQEGDLLMVGEPRNNFPLDPAARHATLVAGGIGITPILGMARHLQEVGTPFTLHYFTRSVEHTAFLDVLSAPDYADTLRLHHALEPDAVAAYLGRELREQPEGGHLYMCGPRPFMDLVHAAAVAWPPQTVHLEYFGADPLQLAGPQDSFEVTLARSGGTYLVPEGRSIVEVLAGYGVKVEVSCEQGICGTCLTHVVEGEPDHKDMFLTDDEKAAGDRMTLCVSRAKSRTLVLDL